MMKCPFRVITTERRLPSDLSLKETVQEFADCCYGKCAAAYVVEYNGIPKVEGCKRLMNQNSL